MITVKKEAYLEYIDDISHILHDHWEEVAHYKDKIPLSPIFEAYEQLDKNGNLFSVIMREDGKVIGYSLYIINRHIHYSTCLCGCNDILFLVPEKRNSNLGLKLITESDKLLISAGINRITYHVKPEHDFSPLLKRLGYIQEEIMYGRFIESQGD